MNPKIWLFISLGVNRAATENSRFKITFLFKKKLEQMVSHFQGKTNKPGLK